MLQNKKWKDKEKVSVILLTLDKLNQYLFSESISAFVIGVLFTKL